MTDSTKHYATLTADERLKLHVEAAARGDWQEAERLGETCPKIKYAAQRDMAYTRKYQDLQTIVLFHLAHFYQYRGAMIAALALNRFRPDAERKATYLARRAEFFALVEGWKRFCAYAGFEPDSACLCLCFSNEPHRHKVDPSQGMTDVR